MSVELNIFPETDELIVCNTPDGRQIEVSLFDLDDIVIEMIEGMDSNLQLSRRLQLKKLVDIFAAKYGYRMSAVSMDALIALKDQKMNTLKKNVFHSASQLSSMESSQEPNESSES
jgi:hypothetical protein